MSLVFFGIFIIPGDLRAGGQVTKMGKVTYVTAGTFYIDLGKQDGLSRGDTLTVLRNERPLGSGVIRHLATRTAIVEMSGEFDINVGDEVRWTGTIHIPEKPPESEPVEIAPSPVHREEKKKTGWIGGSLNYRYRNETTVSGNSYNSHDLLFSLTGKDILGSPVSVTAFGKVLRGTAGTQPEAVIHQLDLRYQKQAGNWEISGGRFYNYSPGGSGATDGFRLIRKFSRSRLDISGGTTRLPGNERTLRLSGTFRWKPVNRWIKTADSELTLLQDNGETTPYFIFDATAGGKKRSAPRWTFSSVMQLSDPAGGSFIPRQINLSTGKSFTPRISGTLYYQFTRGSTVFKSQTENAIAYESINVSFRLQRGNGYLVTLLFAGFRPADEADIYPRVSAQLSNSNWRDRKIRFLTSADLLAGADYNTGRFFVSFRKPVKNWQMQMNGTLLLHQYRTDESFTGNAILSVRGSRKIGDRYKISVLEEYTLSGDRNVNYLSVELRVRF